MNNLIKKVDSGDYIKTKRQMTIFKEFSAANTSQTFYPVKTNGSIYNKNFKLIPTTPAPTTDASNCLIFSKSYELLTDFNTGKIYLKQACDASGN